MAPTAADLPLTLGTAGHIDHGKTALITRLTGTNTDRLREERERGISIELGYAELELPDGLRLSVVDVPGHERFVRAMVAGATGVDLFLLVVAADDGVMPQTVEHLAVIELLGVTQGVVALTKVDLVDDELLEIARHDVVQFLATTPFARAPVVAVSAKDGRGLPDLLDALQDAADRVAATGRSGPARLPVDRVFSLRGIGTVVTGTLWRGEIRAGDQLVVEPGGEGVGVRSVEMHDRAADVVSAGRRVGVGLRGVDRAAVERGDWLVAAESAARFPPPRWFDASVRLLAGARSLKTGERVRLHHGTAQHLARLAFLDRRELEPGDETPAVVRLDGGPAAVEPHDRFILRSLSPVHTIGGGVVLDARPRRWRDRAAHVAFLTAIAADDATEACRLAAADRGLAGLAADDLVTAGVDPAACAAALGALVRSGELEAGLAEGRWFAAGTRRRVAGELTETLGRLGRQRPDRPFVPPAELSAALPGLPAAELGAILQRLVTEGNLIERGGFAVPGAGGALPEEHEALAARVGERLAAARLAPPTLASLEEELGADRKDLTLVLDVLTQRHEAVRAEKDVWFARSAVDEARERLVEALARLPQITLADYRDELGTGRRHAQALLELFDREGLTRRRGDVRVLRPRR